VTVPPPRPPGGRPPRRFGVPLLVLITLAVAACGAAGPSATPALSQPVAVTGPPPASVAATPLPTPAPTPVAYPLSLTDDEGTSVAIPARPAKIVSLTPATTEILFAIGAGDRVVATTDFDDYPPAALSLPHVASYTAVDVEKIVSLGADLVIAGGDGFNPPDAIRQLRDLGIPVVVVYAANVQGVLDDIRLVGEASGQLAAADALAGSMSAQIEAIRATTDSIQRPKVFYEIDATGGIYTAADGSFLEQMLRIAGGDPLTTGSRTSFEIPLEQLVAFNPTLILLGDSAYGVTPDQVAARPGWEGIEAVKSGAIVSVNDLLITRPGPRLVEGLLDLVRAIHPELASALPTEPSASVGP
jgi:cobalamin transport system substrate-binding protein